MSLVDSYSEILSDCNNWNPTTDTDIEHVFPDVLSMPMAYNFIMKLLFKDGNYRDAAKKLYKWKFKIPDIRFTHSVSLYLLGTLAAQEIGYNKFDYPIWDRNSKRNYLHHWVATCLFHDVGYFMEESKDDFKLSEFSTLDKIITYFGMEYDLRKKDTTKLIDGYYNYKISAEAHNGIDHGIVSAMLLYDTLMKRNAYFEEIVKKGGIIFSEKPLLGSNNLLCIKKYCLDIARHNMWYAYDNEPDKQAKYEEFGLNDLIAHSGNTKKICFIDKPVLFLLCLFDTIEPTKKYYAPGKDILEILNEVTILVKNKRDKASVTIQEKSNSKLIESVEDLDNWLDISIEFKTSNSVTFSFPLN